MYEGHGFSRAVNVLAAEVRFSVQVSEIIPFLQPRSN
jgi:hypothetical protein